MTTHIKKEKKHAKQTKKCINHSTSCANLRLANPGKTHKKK